MASRSESLAVSALNTTAASWSGCRGWLSVFLLKENRKLYGINWNIGKTTSTDSAGTTQPIRIWRGVWCFSRILAQATNIVNMTITIPIIGAMMIRAVVQPAITMACTLNLVKK
jgi:hypothetical protein